MSGFATHLKKKQAHVQHHDRAVSERFRVVRFDGVTLGGSTSRAVAERLRNVMCQGGPLSAAPSADVEVNAMQPALNDEDLPALALTHVAAEPLLPLG